MLSPLTSEENGHERHFDRNRLQYDSGFLCEVKGNGKCKNSCVWVFLLGTFIVWTFSYFWVAYTSMSEFIHISSADINNAGKILRLVSVFKKKSPYPNFDYKGNSSI